MSEPSIGGDLAPELHTRAARSSELRLSVFTRFRFQPCAPQDAYGRCSRTGLTSAGESDQLRGMQTVCAASGGLTKLICERREDNRKSITTEKVVIKEKL